MKQVLLILVLILCVTSVAVTAVDSDGFTPANTLRSNPDIIRYIPDKSGIPKYIEGKLAEQVAVGREVDAAIAFFEKNKAAYRMTDPSTELIVQRMDIDDIGMRHLRFSQQYKGLPVIGGNLIAHFTVDGTMKTINGSFRPIDNINVVPALSKAEATNLAVTDLESFFGTGNPQKQELVIFPWEGKTYLCWRMFLYSDTPMGRWEYFVDAGTGEIIYKANRIMNTDAIGTGIGVMGGARNHIDTDYNGSTYRMIDYTRQANNDPHGHGGQMPDGNYIQTNIASSSLPGSVATDADNYWDDATSQRPAVDGQVYSALVYDWWLSQFNRNSYDNAGHSMLTSVNYSAEGDNNAYWNGSQIVIWSWSSGWRSLAGCPDVIAHEWGHAVTENTSNLVYEKEPGALNESFSDMMGAAFEWAHDTLDTPDWLMGENGQTSGDGFRDMSNPHAFGDPDYYGTSDPYWVDVVNCTPSWLNDYCGVHTNSGVGNKWFFLLSDGGVHSGITVTGIGVANAIKVAYRANAFYWNSQTDYHEAAAATMTAADDLDSTGVWSYQASLAWNAVGVSTPSKGLAFSYPNGRPETVSPTQTTTFQVIVTGVNGGQPDPGSGKINYRIDGGAYTSVYMTETSANHYDATLPAVACGSTIEYYISAREVTLGAQTDPDPATPYSAIPATSTTVVFTDNFETNQGWTVSGDATDGQWDRGVPVGGGDRGDPPTDFDGSGSCDLTDNVDDNSDVDGGTTTLTSPTIDLSSGDALIHYARWYSNNFGAAPNSDVFEVYVSNNNGSSWTLVETVGPVNEANGGWYEHSFWVSDFVTPTAQVKVRFDASDLGDGSVVEAAIDDFTVTQYNCEAASGPTITTTSLPDWTIGIAYSQQLTATGGTGVLTWSDKNGDLAGTGLSISSAGLLSGTPTSTGTISFTALVVDDNSQSDEKLLSFNINPAVSITTSSLPDWTAGHAYSQQLAATGGTGTKTWSDVNGDLVGTGLTLSASGLLSGIPVEGPVSFTARVNDSVGAVDQVLFSFTVNPAITITTSSLPDWTADILYSQQLSATGGTGTITWSDMNNNLAGTGLTLSSTGLLSGTPVDGPVSFTALVTDDVNATDQQLLSFTVNPAIQITTTTLPDWTVGMSYSQQLTATGGTGVKTWSDVNGDLAGTGLTLSSSGLLSGTPIEGSISFTAQVSDDIGSTDQQLLNFTINPTVAITTVSIPDWTAGVAYSVQLVSSGGTGTKTWTDKNGDLSGTGLTLSASGVLSGTPTAGTISFTAEVADVAGATDEKLLTCTINPAITIVDNTLPDGIRDSAYSVQLTATGGTGSLVWTDKNNNLAVWGLSISTSGLISGTCTDTGLVILIVRVDDNVGGFTEKDFSFRIEPPYICGDVDGNGDGPDVADLSYLVAFLFQGGPPPPVMNTADLDQVDGVTVSDLTTLVEYLFGSGPELTCP